MRIFINALSAKLGGGQTYIINLLDHIHTHLDDGDRVYLVAPLNLKLKDHLFLTRINPYWPTNNPILRSLWEQLILPFILFALKIDLLFCPGGVLSTETFHKCKKITMFRNMAPFDKEFTYSLPLISLLRNVLLKHIFIKSMKKADGVIFISQFAKEFILQQKNMRLKKSIIIPHGIILPNRLETLPEELAKKIPKHYFLYTSIFHSYKHQLELVRAFKKYKENGPLQYKDHQLILVGKNDTEYGKLVKDEISKLDLENQIILLGNIPYQYVHFLYSHSDLNIFASSCENCPNILLEMLGAGRAILVSNIAPMPEFSQDAALYFNPKDPENIYQQLHLLTSDHLLMNTLAEKVKIRSKNYSWEKVAEETVQFLKSLN